MDNVLANPIKAIRKSNSIAFILLLTAVLIYQVTILLENNYITEETLEFNLSNQHRLLSQRIEKNLVSSLVADDYFSRDRFINNARQDVNSLAANHKSLLAAARHTTLFHPSDERTLSFYQESSIYLEKMRDAVFTAVAYSERLELGDAEQQALDHAVKAYQENQQKFLNLIESATNLSAANASDYFSHLPRLSWGLVGLILMVMLLNHRLIHGRSVKTAKTQYYQLEKRLEFQNALLNSAHEAVITLSTTGEISLFSASACRMFGYEVNEIVGKNFAQLIAESSLEIKAQNFEVQGVRRNQEVFPALIQIEELKTARQHVFIGFIRDLTEEKKAELKLLQAKQAAEEANKAKSQFLSNISHELKTPLNAILGFSQLLETDDTEPLTPEQAESVRHIYNAGKLLLALISDVLDLSKIETGNVKLNIEETSVNEIILEALNLINNIAKEHHINIKTRFDPLSSTIIAVDPLRFKQILINLLSNAIKYNSENGLIVLRSKVENNRVRISVKDSGKGIDESKIMELFQPFNRLGAEQTEIEGTGIGLCIAKNLVERMGGTIGVSNNKGPGCCFWVEFPIIPPPIKQQNGASETYKKLQEEFNYLQESLNVIGLVKNPQQQTDLANQALDETKADNSTQTLH